VADQNPANQSEHRDNDRVASKHRIEDASYAVLIVENQRGTLVGHLRRVLKNSKECTLHAPINDCERPKLKEKEVKRNT
jgi:hypothetical protein